MTTFMSQPTQLPILSILRDKENISTSSPSSPTSSSSSPSNNAPLPSIRAAAESIITSSSSSSNSNETTPVFSASKDNRQTSIIVEHRSRSSSPIKPSSETVSKSFPSQKRTTRSSSNRHQSPSTSSSSSPSSSSLQTKLRSSNLRANTSSSKKSSPPESSTSSSSSKFRLPLKLPQPTLTPITNPYLDLNGHLSYHGLDLLARELTEANVPIDYACSAFFSQAAGGPIGLLDRTTTLFYPQEVETRKQLSSIPNGGLPDRLELKLESEINGNPTPSHVLAVCSSSTSSTNDFNDGLLLPIHSLPYALQCISLPSLTGSISATETSLTSSKLLTGLTTLPIIPLRVPKPAAFPTTHTYLYTRDPASLLAAVIPMGVITRHWNHLERTIENRNDLPNPSLAAIEALSHQSSKDLLKHAKDIHSVWANGVAIGLVNGGYWDTLDKAWSIVIGALIRKKELSLREDIIKTGEEFSKTSL